PRPPPKRRKTDRADPMTAAKPHATSTTASPLVTNRARRTGSAPFARSPATTTAAHFRPSARRALVPPVRPEPTVRGSGPPESLATSTPTGTEPDRQASAT